MSATAFWLNKLSAPKMLFASADEAARTIFFMIMPFVLALAYLRLWSPQKRGANGSAPKGSGAGTVAAEHPASEQARTPFLRILYGTQTGTARRVAESLEREIFALRVSGVCYATSMSDLAEYDQDNLEHEHIVVFVLSTWTGGVPPESARIFCAWLEDMVQDFRVSRKWLQRVKFAVYGLGNSSYDENYCKAARQLDARLSALGAERICLTGRADDMEDLEQQFGPWKDSFCAALCERYASTEADAKATSSFVGDPPEIKLGATADADAKKPERLPLKEYRRRKRQAKEREAARKRRLEAAEAEAGAEAEDMLNAQLVMSDDEDGDDDGAAPAGCGGGGRAADSKEPALTDLEDLGVEMDVGGG